MKGMRRGASAYTWLGYLLPELDPDHRGRIINLPTAGNATLPVRHLPRWSLVLTALVLVQVTEHAHPAVRLRLAP